MNQEATSDAREVVSNSERDPVWFIRKLLRCRPWPVQEKIIRSVFQNRRTAVRACHASGKSWVAGRIVPAFLYTRVPSKVITTAPTDRQVRHILWSEIGAAHQRAGKLLGGELLTQELRIDKDWWAYGFSAPEFDPDRFQGFHSPHVLVVVDEASGIADLIMEQIDSLCAGGDAHLLLIGNPVNPNSAFKRECDSESTSVITIDAFDTPNLSAFGITEADIASGEWVAKVGDRPLPFPELITPAWVAEVYDKWGPKSPRYKARVRGLFPDVVEHAVYETEMVAAEQDGRIGNVAADPRVPVDTCWDLGTRNKMSIWFLQSVGREVRAVHYIEGTGKGLPHYARELQRIQAERGFLYGEHHAPHDIAVTELGTGKTRLEAAAGLGIRFRVAPRLKLEDGIDEVRALLGRTWFDRRNCEAGIAALKSYRYEYDEEHKVLSNLPVKDWSSDGSDAFRTGAIGMREVIMQAPRKPRDYSWMA